MILEAGLTAELVVGSELGDCITHIADDLQILGSRKVTYVVGGVRDRVFARYLTRLTSAGKSFIWKSAQDDFFSAKHAYDHFGDLLIVQTRQLETRNLSWGYLN